MQRRFPMMSPVRFDEDILQTAKMPVEPAFREITAGLNARIAELLKDPNKMGIGCCFEGCCVSWCCIQLV